MSKIRMSNCLKTTEEVRAVIKRNLADIDGKVKITLTNMKSKGLKIAKSLTKLAAIPRVGRAIMKIIWIYSTVKDINTMRIWKKMTLCLISKMNKTKIMVIDSK